MAKKETKKVEQVIFEMGKPIEGKVFKGNTFEMVKTTHGIAYRLYGGYSIFVTPNNIALYETLDDLIENQEVYSKLEGQEKDDFELNLSAITYVLDVPLFAFSNAEFTFHIAEEVIKFLQSVYDKAISEPLKDETLQDVKDNIEFEQAVKGIEELKTSLNEEVN